MYDETNVPLPEYRVRPVVRYVVTRYCHPYTASDGSHGMPGSSTVVAELTDERQADEMVEALSSYDFKIRQEQSIRRIFGENQTAPGVVTMAKVDQSEVSGSGCG